MQETMYAEMTSMETLLLPSSHLRVGCDLAGRPERSLDFQEQRESKQTLESRCVDLVLELTVLAWGC